MGKDYTVRIEGKGYSFELEIRDSRLREIYDQDPEYFHSVIRSNIMISFGDLEAPEDLELRTLLGKISLESVHRRLEALRVFEEQRKPERFH